MAPLVDLSNVNIDESRRFALKWVDEAKAKPLAEEGADEEDLINKVNPPPIKLHKENKSLKSNLKGSKLNSAQKV